MPMSLLRRCEILMGYYIMCVYFLALMKPVLYHIIANNCLIHQEITNISDQLVASDLRDADIGAGYRVDEDPPLPSIQIWTQLELWDEYN